MKSGSNKQTERKRAVRMTDVARNLGVSQATVSYVLNGKAEATHISESTVQRIIDEVRRLNYQPNRQAKSLSTRQTLTVGVLLNGVWGKYGQSIMDGLQPVLDGMGYMPIIAMHRWDDARERAEVRSLLALCVDGLIVQPQPKSCRKTYQPLLDAGVPLLFFGDAPTDMPEAHCVAWDCAEAVKVAVERLVEMGRTKIGFVGVRYPFKYNEDRYAAFCSALKAHGIKLNKKWVAWENLAEEPGSLLDGMFSPKGDHPNAIFAMNDTAGLQAIQRLMGRGIRVPVDVAVIGLGDYSESFEFTAVMTAVHEPLVQMGREAGRIILDAIRNPALPTVRSLVEGSRLVRRPSTEGWSRMGFG
ncbi:MAG: LacI family DNA-binding transcriptional regulator [bacterium]